ncbi:MAG TPA: TonB-dependent receptor [Pyrinomonadaceae bacterium]|nr:TonB-dependent receptor [Pyrinomonadaceae bacterium]
MQFFNWIIRVSVVIAFVIACTTAFAQTGTSNITGSVIDSSGAVVPGATVTATNEATGVKSTQTTTDSGVYAFSSLPVGNYTIMVEKQGFKTLVKTNNALQVGTPLTVDVSLEVGSVEEKVTVVGGAEQLNTANATIGNVVEQKAIETLPLNGRNPLSLLLLEPGVTQRSAGATGSGVHVNGSRDRAFNVTIDGIEANESSVPNPVSNLYRLTPDNVQEYKVTTNNATAEEGRNSGASISVATRSGTSEFHGTGYLFIRNEGFNSNEFFASAQGTPKPVIRMFQPGFEMGGPIRKNKTFFFGSYQYNRIDFTQPIDQTFGTPLVLTATARAGVFRYFIPDSSNPLVVGGTTITRNSPLLVNPLTGVPIVPNCGGAITVRCIASYDTRPGAGNNTLGKTLDSVVAGILNPWPLPNAFTSGDGLNTGAFLWNPPTAVRGPAYAARVDHNFNGSNSMFVRYLFSDYNTLKGDPLNGRPQVFPSEPPLGEVFRRTSNLAVSYRRVFSPRVVNELTFGYARFGFLFTQGEANPAWPDNPPYDFSNISEGYINTPRTARWVTSPQILDNLSLVHGSHVFRTGMNFRFYRHVDQRGQPGGINVTPSITFSGSTRPAFKTTASAACPGPNCNSGFIAPVGAINNTDQTNLSAYINNLYGLPASINQVFLGNLNNDAFLPFKTGDSVTLYAQKHNADQYNLYFQDEWKVRPNLTLNYGARWEINPPLNTSPAGSVFVATTPIAGTPLPATPVVNASGAVTFAPAKRWYEGDFKWAIGPRFGLAWSPDFKNGFLNKLTGGSGRSVIRLGYGLAFDTISSFQVTAVAGRIPGEVQSCASSFSTTTQSFSTITNGCANSAALFTSLNNTIAGGFPTVLPAPILKPSSLLTPPQQLNTNAPPVTVFAPHMQLPTVHQWNLSLQRELPWGLVMEAGYIGRRGEHLFMAYNINQINSDPILPSFLIMQQNIAIAGCRPSGTTSAGVACGTVPPVRAQLIAAGLSATAADSNVLNATATLTDLQFNAAGSFAERIENNTLGLKLRPNQQFSRITYLDNSGDSNYHAAQFTLRRRFTSGFGLSLAYTFGKSIDNQSVDPVGSTSGGALTNTTSRAPMDIRNFRLDRGRSDFDRRQILQGATVWEVPVGKGKHFLASSSGIVNHILGGWTINTLFNYMTGEPFSVMAGGDSTAAPGGRTANAAHTSRAIMQRPVSAELQYLTGQTSLGPVLFPTSTALACGRDPNSPFCIPAPGQNGDGRNLFTAPSYWNLDLGFIKTFQISERFKLQFRTEMFNALNHANFDNPRDASVGSPSLSSQDFGRVCCATVAPPSTQTVVQTGEAARVIQFALKLQF